MVSFAALQATAGLGMGFATFLAAFRLLQSTGSATAYGIVAATSLVPSGLASPWIGAWIDREDPRRMTWTCATVSAASVLIMACVAWLDLQSPAWAWLSLSLAYLSLTALYSAEVPYARGLVPYRHLSRANAALQLTAWVPRLAGAAVASFAFAAGRSAWIGFGVAAAILVAGRFAFASTWAFQIAEPELADDAQSSEGALQVAFRVFRADTMVVALLLLLFMRRAAIDALSVLVHPMMLRHGTAELVGVVMGAGTVGFALAGVALILVRVQRPLVWILAASAAGAAGMVALGLGSEPVILIAAGLTIYAADLAAIAANQLWWQRAVPMRRLGRVTTIRDVLIGSGGLVGALAAGPAAAAVAARWGVGEGEGGVVVLAAFAGAGRGDGRRRVHPVAAAALSRSRSSHPFGNTSGSSMKSSIGARAS